MAFPTNSLIQLFDTIPAAAGITTNLTTNAFVKTTQDLVVPANEGPQYWSFVLQGTFASEPGAATNPVELHIRPMNIVGSNDPIAPGGGTTAFTGHKVGDLLMADVATAQYSKPLVVDFALLQTVVSQTFELYVMNPNTPSIASGTADLYFAPKTWGGKP